MLSFGGAAWAGVTDGVFRTHFTITTTADANAIPMEMALIGNQACLVK
jgi:hypothetical protein